MIYSGTCTKEIITVCPMNNKRDRQFIEIYKNADECTFNVTINTNNKLYVWSFVMSDNSVYEIVKYAIFDMVLKCDTMTRLCLALDRTFIENFSNYMIFNKDNHNDCRKACKHKN